MQSPGPLSLIIVSLSLALIPLFLTLSTCYLKVSIVLGILRSGLGTQNAPSNLAIAALSIAISAIVMSPVVRSIVKNSEKVNYSTLTQAKLDQVIITISEVIEPWRVFLNEQVQESEFKLVSKLARRTEVTEDPSTVKALDILIPAFVLSETKKSFTMAFALFLPFLLIDLIVGNLLVGMGLTMVSPAMVSIPFKLLLFSAADAWFLIAKTFTESYSL